MPTDWACIVGFKPCCDASRADGMIAWKAYSNLDSAVLSTEDAIIFQTDAAAFLGVVDAILYLEELIEEGFGHFDSCNLVIELLICWFVI